MVAGANAGVKAAGAGGGNFSRLPFNASFRISPSVISTTPRALPLIPPPPPPPLLAAAAAAVVAAAAYDNHAPCSSSHACLGMASHPAASAAGAHRIVR